MDWDWDGQLYLILSNGDVHQRGLRAQGSTVAWIGPFSIGNFWESSQDTLRVDAQIVGLEFCGFHAVPADAMSMLRNGTFLVLLDDGRFFQRAAIRDSTGMHLADGVPVERGNLRLPE
jgi:hypothetical protein